MTLPLYILESSPSFKDNIECNEEKLHRIFGCELIQEAGILLRQPQVVISTGQNILHRFLYRKSLKNFDVFTIAMGSILLSSKIEEKIKVIREIIFVFNHIYHNRKQIKIIPIELGGQRYTSWKTELISIERIILKDLGFSFYNIVDHPHKYILYFIKILNGSNDLSQMSWNYINDSMRLDLSLRYPAQVIACAAIYLSARILNIKLPESWWNVMTDDINNIHVICDRILELYHIPKLMWIEPIANAKYLDEI